MLNKIIESSNYVANHSKHVKMNISKLEEFAKSIENIQLTHWLGTSPYGLLELPISKVINFLVLFEAIDFSFWGEPKWTIETIHGKLDGSIALLYCLLNYVKQSNNIDFSKISKQEFSEILKGNVEIPLLNERYQIIKNTSQIINEKMNGDFYSFIRNVTNDTELFSIITNYFPDFKDERIYQGQTIYFYKLAQLLTSDILHMREQKENIEVDYSHLVGCSDYKIPQVMRGLGILEYSQGLANIVDNQKEILINSDYEVEIRANMLVVIQKIKEKLNNKICAININDYIWGQSKKLTLQPYHLTRNTNY